MKKILMMAALFLSTTAFAQMSEIRGVAKNTTLKEISLFKIVDGEIELMATSSISSTGAFGFLFEPENEGFFVVGYDKLGLAQWPLYLKKGDKASIATDGKWMKFVGPQTPENTVYSSWVNLTQDIKYKAIYFIDPPLSTYKDFFPEFEKVLSQVDAFKKTIKTKNATFNHLMNSIARYDMDYLALNFLLTPRKAHPTEAERMPYYSTIEQKNKFPDDDILSMPNGMKFMRSYASFTGKPKSTLKERSEYFTTDVQKGAYLIEVGASSFRDYRDYTNFVKEYNQYFQTPSLQEKIDAVGKKMYHGSPGGTAWDFNFVDKDGKMVTMKDLKGKVVLIDVWATWCGPCKQEIPFMQKLEDELHDKDITFVSISIDKDTDKDKWAAFVNNMKMGGVQLFAGSAGGKSLDQVYTMPTIPRFMVFDRDGKIVNLKAPRPSDPALKALLLQTVEGKTGSTVVQKPGLPPGFKMPASMGAQKPVSTDAQKPVSNN
ncbi:TlpA family protein disulfide reductase [Pinibacter soli]|uniref:TlpA disulfide reductase family protein n=1 Tax=Pinibacter soli TaxID=3044211 RepID=A0ABT6RBM4_9BACT|nr:TlpA disulfide reductase family protein [Pinibacter soli]MDI3319800.1 TlpA disulfide reductase family protein [Pinibacter soli]